MNDYRITNDLGEIRTWEELYEDNFLLNKAYKDLQQENKQLKVKSEVLEENNKLLIQQKAQMYKDLDIAYEKIDKAIEYIKTHTKIIPFNEIGEGGGLELTDYDIADLLEILEVKKNYN